MIGFFCPLTFITDPFKTPVSGYLPPPPPPATTYLFIIFLNIVPYQGPGCPELFGFDGVTLRASGEQTFMNSLVHCL